MTKTTTKNIHNSIAESDKNILFQDPDTDFDMDSRTLDEQKILKILQNERYKSDTIDRKWLAKWAASVVTTWLAVVLFLLVFNTPFCFFVSDSVLIALLGTTTLNVLGLSFIVLQGHFKDKEKERFTAL
jgi:hypothetical protein